MARNEARRQQKLMKQRHKDRVRRKVRLEAIPYSAMNAKKKIQLARQYPLHECLINPSWKDKGLATIVVSRRQPDGNILYLEGNIPGSKNGLLIIRRSVKAKVTGGEDGKNDVY